MMAPGAPVDDTHGVELPSRYEIRGVTADLADSIAALSFHSHFFESEVWSRIYEGCQTRSALRAYHECKPFYQLPETSAKNGLSYFIWDKEFVFKRPESAARGGICFWDDFDLNDPDLEVDGQQKLYDALDIAIVGFGLAYDKFVPGDPKGWAAAEKALPLNTPINTFLQVQDPRPKGSWEATAPGQVIERTGTGTRQGYHGQGLMKALAKFIMLEMKSRGFRAIQITCGAPQVHHVWMNPPKPFRSSTLGAFPNWIFEAEEDGNKIRPYEKAGAANFFLVWVELLD
ncbi:hypothetical protein GGR52DRAFT_558236 [Hypoxylon sp. FL1284]|nr:hypothetical protein GGR52DRAFT_558236 [Hypoxylon sp. FL1284]